MVCSRALIGYSSRMKMEDLPSGESETSLKGQFLVAMPGIGDERFEDTVIYLVGHSEDGAMGLIVNDVLPDLSFGDILSELDLAPDEEHIRVPDHIRDRHVLRGGPVDTGRGFVLHSSDYFRKGSSFPVNQDINLTASQEILRSISRGEAPEKSLLALGYCGWGPGQLEGELKDNGWLTVPQSIDILFGLKPEERYDASLGLLGINRASLSVISGTA